MKVGAEIPRAFLGLPDSSDGDFLRLQRRLRLLAVRALLVYPVERLPSDLAGALRSLRRELTEKCGTIQLLEL